MASTPNATVAHGTRLTVRKTNSTFTTQKLPVLVAIPKASIQAYCALPFQCPAAMAQSPTSTICDLSVAPPRWSPDSLTVNSQHSGSLRCERWTEESFQFELSCAGDRWNHIHNVVKTNHENMRECKRGHIEHEYSLVSTSSSPPDPKNRIKMTERFNRRSWHPPLLSQLSSIPANGSLRMR
jgi:hypothetical protein